MNARVKFNVLYLDEAILFLNSLDEKVKNKVTYNLLKARTVLDKDLFKKLKGTDIWEFRTLYEGRTYRLFAFWDTEIDSLVVATHGIVKKTQKTPYKEIEKAERIRNNYFNERRS